MGDPLAGNVEPWAVELLLLQFAAGVVILRALVGRGFRTSYLAITVLGLAVGAVGLSAMRHDAGDRGPLTTPAQRGPEIRAKGRQVAAVGFGAAYGGAVGAVMLWRTLPPAPNSTVADRRRDQDGN